ncbi:hypothetical protein [Spiroplasma endosymbiont of Nebria brevicollis]|uniref:hypothetical protein n=1 Tax=Spiroplasma endosymbiont of Nebria brevicollis TaxID=3066284 RepID=UPI00313DA60D
MPWFNIFQDNKPDIENVDFDIIFDEFKELISEWKSNTKIFSNNVENTIENSATSSAIVAALQVVNEEKINNTIKHLKDSLKYQLFWFFWEKNQN